MRLATALLLASSMVVTSSCQSSSAPAEPDASTEASALLPCDVDDVLARNCRHCHSAPPKFGAPMALGNAADVAAPSRTDPSRPVSARIAERIHDPLAPMPQGAKMSGADLAVLDAWIARGAPAASASTPSCADGGAGEDGGAPSGPDLLPCPPEQRTTFLAHGATATEPFAVAADAGNLYECFTWKAPWTTTTQATAFAPIIGDSRVVHHWILFETSTPQIEGGVGACKMPFDAKFLQGWAPGGTNRVLPEDVGLGLPGADRYLILQVHYWNVAGYTDIRDRSGVSMCTATGPNLRPKTAVVSTLGTANIDIPPRASRTVATGRCTPQVTEPIHVLAAAPHMHKRGRALRTEILRGGSESTIETLVDEQSFDFQSQRAYASSTVIQPGDVLRTTCTYENASDSHVTFGEKTEDEMCFDFLTVWPAPGLVNGGGKGAQRCIDP